MRPASYYNEFDPHAAAWLRELIRAGEIPDGEVDERSIIDVRPDDLRGFIQCHFFAGIGGWPYALRLARIPEDTSVWTGSPPCQPFSVAGKQEGKNDERHLSPHFLGLVGACRPRLLFGEQVASAEVFGKATGGTGRNYFGPPSWAWLDDLCDRLEAARYAVGASDIPAAGVGAPHIRQRTFFGAVELDGLADAEGRRKSGRLRERGSSEWAERTPGRHSSTGGLAAADDAGPQGRIEPGRGRAAELAAGTRGLAGGLADAGNSAGQRSKPRTTIGGLQAQNWRDTSVVATDAPDSPWGAADWLLCRNERWRPVEPIDERMAYGVSIALDARLFEVVDAQTRQILAAETLRAMRNGHGPQAIWGSVGGYCGFPAASVLLAILCEHTGALGHFQHFWPTSGEKDRIARHLQQVWLRFGALAGPPSGRGFSEQLARQLGNSLPKLPRKGAPPRWRALTMLTAGPLAENVSDRVGLLRGYGNAIVPQAAAEFVMAFLDACKLQHGIQR